MKEHKNNQELIDYLISKNVIINNKELALKNIEPTYDRKEYLCNLYMIIKCLKVLLDEEKYKEFELLFNRELDTLKDKLIVIDINDILRIMGYDV